VVAADLDGDGVLDLALANADFDTVSVLHGNGDGSFAPRRSWRVGGKPCRLLAVDWDADGKLDLVSVGGDSGELWILHNDHGSFAARGRPTKLGVGVTDFAVADLNGDKQLDVVAIGRSRLVILLRDGDGFAAEQRLRLDSEPTALAVADLDGDGKLDLITAHAQPEKIMRLMGRGDGTFAVPESVATKVAAARLVVADFDGDGKADVAVLGSQQRWGLLSGTGAGELGQPRFFTVEGSLRDLVAGDFNGDKRLDVAIAGTAPKPREPRPSRYCESDHIDEPGVVRVWLNQGSGGFADAEVLATGAEPLSLVAADFDRDGRVDFAVACNADGSVVRTSAPKTWKAKP
jgi:hypothetical protein